MIGDNIRQLRISNDMTQIELSRRLGVSNRTVCSWESNRTEPNMGMVEKLVSALGCSKTDLIYGFESLPKTTAIADPFFAKYEQLDATDKEFVSRTVDGLLAADKYQAKKDMNA